MKKPSAASLKRVTAENLTRLGADRLAEILLEVADTRVELKRRLRMELAADQGAEHLLPEIDRRIALLAASRGAVSWRQKPAFVRDLEGVRRLIVDRLSALDLMAAQDRIVAFLGVAQPSRRRVRDSEGGLEAVFERAARDCVVLLARSDLRESAASMAAAIVNQPADWGRWTRQDLFADHADLAGAALPYLQDRTGPTWAPVLRALAKAANNPDVYRSTYTPEALRTPQVAASVAERYLADNRLGEARSVLEAAIQPGLIKRGKSGTQGPDYDWETAWIGYLEKAGRLTEAQEARWSSFERTASIERAKAYVSRLPDFEDVEAETRVFATVRGYPDPERALALLIEWPALGEASRFIDRRGAELSLNPEQAEGWARRLGRRYPQAAEQLLRGAAAGAFRRREYGTSSRLTEAANALSATSL